MTNQENAASRYLWPADCFMGRSLLLPTFMHRRVGERFPHRDQGDLHMSFNRQFLRIYPVDGVTVLFLGEMEIWDGADMALLRESLMKLCVQEKKRAIGIDMTYVKYIPGGFFGLLFDWHEQGVQIRLYSPQPNVRKMLWFDRFFDPISEFEFELRPGRADEFPLGFAEEEAGMLPEAVYGRMFAETVA